jgi:ectoine hydroxylase-related dioxygenase (phytanoyl-CoA dioxygenase family)
MEDIKSQYEQKGYWVAKNILSPQDLEPIEDRAMAAINSSYKSIARLNDEGWVSYAKDNPQCVAKVYDDMRDDNVFITLGSSPSITSVVKLLVREPQLYRKVPFRIDVPFETKELAFWHQDAFYVAGNDEELTVWIPMYDTAVQQGALQVMPGSHKNGRVPHTLSVGKKMLPCSVYDSEIRYVEMKRGDALFFSSFLIHTSSLNISDEIRYSIQLRYTTGLRAPSTEMKGTINV